MFPQTTSVYKHTLEELFERQRRGEDVTEIIRELVWQGLGRILT